MFHIIFHATNVGIDESDRVRFWQDFVASMAHILLVLREFSRILGRHANVWLFDFILCRLRSRDNAMFLHTQQVVDIRLTILSPHSIANFVADAADDVYAQCASSSLAQFGTR